MLLSYFQNHTVNEYVGRSEIRDVFVQLRSNVAMFAGRFYRISPSTVAIFLNVTHDSIEICGNRACRA